MIVKHEIELRRGGFLRILRQDATDAICIRIVLEDKNGRPQSFRDLSCVDLPLLLKALYEEHVENAKIIAKHREEIAVKKGFGRTGK